MDKYLSDKLNEALLEDEAKRASYAPKFSLDISDVLRCQRMRWLKYYNFPAKAFDAETLKRFKMGSIVEDVVVNLLKLKGIIVRHHQYVVSKIDSRIRGKSDFTILKDDKQFLTEMKSKDGYQFWKRKKEDSPLLNYIGQGLTYLHTLIDHEPLESSVCILEVSRDNLTPIESYSEPLEKAWGPIENDWETMLDWVDTKKLPPVIEGFPKNYMCVSCRYRKDCMSLEREGVKRLD